MYKLILTIAAATLMLTSCAAPANTSHPNRATIETASVVTELPCPEPTPDPPVVPPAPSEPSGLVSGTIRWSNTTTWIVLDDSDHTPSGIASVQLLPDRVRVHYDFTAVKVSSMQVTSDEAFASADVRVGASVGLSYADIYFYMPSYGSAPVPPKLLSKAGANVWITGLFWLE